MRTENVCYSKPFLILPADTIQDTSFVINISCAFRNATRLLIRVVRDYSSTQIQGNSVVPLRTGFQWPVVPLVQEGRLQVSAMGSIYQA